MSKKKLEALKEKVEEMHDDVLEKEIMTEMQLHHTSRFRLKKRRQLKRRIADFAEAHKNVHGIINQDDEILLKQEHLIERTIGAFKVMSDMETKLKSLV